MSAKPWTSDHQREALRRTYELAARSVGIIGHDASGFTMVSEVQIETERSWRTTLGQFIAESDLDREVVRVRALAEGRLVRETWYRVGSFTTHIRSSAATRAREDKRAIVRVTRIRRAAP